MDQAAIQQYITGDAMVRQLDRRRKLLQALAGGAGFGVGGGPSRGRAPFARGNAMGRMPDQALAAILEAMQRGQGQGKPPMDVGRYNPLAALQSNAAPTASFRALYR